MALIETPSPGIPDEEGTPLSQEAQLKPQNIIDFDKAVDALDDLFNEGCEAEQYDELRSRANLVSSQLNHVSLEDVAIAKITKAIDRFFVCGETLQSEEHSAQGAQLYKLLP
jgi:hypothetical protein